MLINKLWNNDIQFSLKFAVYPWEDLNLDEGLCIFCSQAAKVAYRNARIINWGQLKTYFGLGLGDLEHEPDSEPELSYSDSD
jgi:hypothetical protein